MKKNLIKALMLTLSLGLVGGLTACNKEAKEPELVYGEVTYNSESLIYERVATTDKHRVQVVCDAGISAEYPFQVMSAEQLTKVLTVVTAERSFVKLTGDFEVKDANLSGLTIDGNGKTLTVNGTSTLTNILLNGNLILDGTSTLKDIKANDVKVLAGAKVSLDTTEESNYPTYVINTLTLGYEKEGDKTSTLTLYNDARIINFQNEFADGSIQKINLRGDYIYTSNSEWASHHD